VLEKMFVADVDVVRNPPTSNVERNQFKVSRSGRIGYAVAQLIEARSRKVTGSISDSVIGIFH
jgi:hypothetical protein